MTTAPARPPVDRRLLIAVIAVGAAVLLALIIVIVLLARNAGPTTASAPTPLDTSSTSATASADSSTTASAAATPSPTVAPQPSSGSTGGGSTGGGSTATGGAFSVFSPTTTVACSFGATDSGGVGYSAPPPQIRVTWKAVRSQGVYFAMGNTDGASSGLTKLPVSGSDANFDGPVTFPCSNPSGTQEYSLTLVGTDGKHVTKTWIVTNVGDKP